ncbi:aminoacyl-tRNA hydrolase [Candidatus Shikimatogenerans bostrichidophilus]|uniref:aminoacyl-tRNA hydrolase n=1 Tax=Candidatus Shikimatogenerans bostrichidophilus TaxID=2943807 RepID=UPI002966A79F
MNNKYLIVGLGNKNNKLKYSRHNIGKLIVNKLIFNKNNIYFKNLYGIIYKRYYYNTKLLLLLSNSNINVIGLSIKYFLNKYHLKYTNLIIICDDIYIKFGKIKLKIKGGSGGHNGLKSIANILNTNNYIRIKIGIGNNFKYGNQNKYVLENIKNNDLNELYNKIYYLVYNKIINIIK